MANFFALTATAGRRCLRRRLAEANAGTSAVLVDKWVQKRPQNQATGKQKGDMTTKIRDARSDEPVLLDHFVCRSEGGVFRPSA
jgi:hypothetical protein